MASRLEHPSAAHSLHSCQPGGGVRTRSSVQVANMLVVVLVACVAICAMRPPYKQNKETQRTRTHTQETQHNSKLYKQLLVPNRHPVFAKLRTFIQKPEEEETCETEQVGSIRNKHGSGSCDSWRRSKTNTKCEMAALDLAQNKRTASTTTKLSAQKQTAPHHTNATQMNIHIEKNTESKQSTEA
jgi:hypothetical protein